MAGRTQNSDPSSFGIVIFRAESDEAARRFMEEDPAVVGGVMTAELFPLPDGVDGALSRARSKGRLFVAVNQ